MPRNRYEDDRTELGRRAAAHMRTENQKWNRAAKIMDLLKQTKRLSDHRRERRR